jgi:hypothetical protein
MLCIICARAVVRRSEATKQIKSAYREENKNQFVRGMNVKQTKGEKRNPIKI